MVVAIQPSYPRFASYCEYHISIHYSTFFWDLKNPLGSFFVKDLCLYANESQAANQSA